ncbi:hypothetical protein JCM6882_007978 [Rhodosporidiobolus microsporus]
MTSLLARHGAHEEGPESAVAGMGALFSSSPTFPSLTFTPAPEHSTTEHAMNTHFTTSLGTSTLWFAGWTPSTALSTFGACVGLFLLAVLSRALTALQAYLERRWTALLRQSSLPYEHGELDKVSSISVGSSASSAPPFRFAVELPRAVLFTVHAFVAYLLMLAVMTFNVFFLLAVLGGLFVGEVGVGRFAAGGRLGE